VRCCSAALAAVPVLFFAGCGHSGDSTSPKAARASTSAPIPTPIGVGARFEPGARAASLGGPRNGLRCTRPGTAGGDLAHLELFAEGRVFLVPQGIGIALPVTHGLQRIVSGRCRYPLATFDRTGTVDFTRPGLTLEDLFAVWGEPLSATRLATFSARPGSEVHAFVDGARWPGSVRDVPLTHHAEIVLEVDSSVPPHRFYLFPR